jgi:putative ABC transport system substrate-binding protein
MDGVSAVYRLIAAAFRAALLALLLACDPAFARSPNVAVILSSPAAPYVELADAIRADVERAGGATRVVALTDVARIDSANTEVVVAVGLKASEAAAALDPQLPVINTLIPRASFERVAVRRGERGTFTAVFLDQPVARQLDLIRLALPTHQRVGVILGPDSAGMLPALTAETGARGMTLHAVRVRDESELSATLPAVLGEIDVLLSLPDSVVFNSRTIQTILFSAYRRQIPVFGFSPAYVRAGALLAVHSTPAQLGRQVAEMLQRPVAQAALPPAQYPRYFSVDVNEHVARSLEIRLERAEVLETRLRAPPVPPR